MTIREWLDNMPTDIRANIATNQNRSAFGGYNGRHLQFMNGYTLSIQWGYGNYCSNFTRLYADITNPVDYDSPDAEIACWNHEGIWLKFEDDDSVCGYQSPEQIEKFAREVMNL